MSREINPFGLRMPAELRESVEAAARLSGRSLNAEIVSRLQESFAWEADDPADQSQSAELLRELVSRIDGLEAVVAERLEAAQEAKRRRGVKKAK